VDELEAEREENEIAIKRSGGKGKSRSVGRSTRAVVDDGQKIAQAGKKFAIMEQLWVPDLSILECKTSQMRQLKKEDEQGYYLAKAYRKALSDAGVENVDDVASQPQTISLVRLYQFSDFRC
jgi:hypothetical protein